VFYEFKRIICFVAKVKEKTMANKKFWVGMLVMVLAFGMMVVGCDNPTNNGGSNNGSTIFDPTGTWDFTVNGMATIITITGNSWTFAIPAIGENDTGTFTRSGNTATLFSNTLQAINGTATMTSATTMTLTLVPPSAITGVFPGTKRAETIFDPTGTWDFTINGMATIITITGNNWTFAIPAIGENDTGTFTRSGNTATLFSNTLQAVNGTATMTSATTMILTLIPPSVITGAFPGTLRN